MFDKVTINQPTKEIRTNTETHIIDGLGTNKLIKESAEFFKELSIEAKNSVLASVNIKNNLLHDIHAVFCSNSFFNGLSVRYEFKINDITFNNIVNTDACDIVKYGVNIVIKNLYDDILSNISKIITQQVIIDSINLELLDDELKARFK